MQNLSTQLICEWACKLFDKKFTDIKSLAQHLIQSGASYGKKAALFSMMYDSSGKSDIMMSYGLLVIGHHWWPS